MNKIRYKCEVKYGRGRWPPNSKLFPFQEVNLMLFCNCKSDGMSWKGVLFYEYIPCWAVVIFIAKHITKATSSISWYALLNLINSITQPPDNFWNALCNLYYKNKRKRNWFEGINVNLKLCSRHNYWEKHKVEGNL